MSQSDPSLLIFVSAGAAVVVGGWLLYHKKFTTGTIEDKSTSASNNNLCLPPLGPPLAEFGKIATDCSLARHQLPWSERYGLVFQINSPLPRFLLSPIVMVGDVQVAKQLLVTMQSQRKFISRPPNVA
jgi:hypothetical protein